MEADEFEFGYHRLEFKQIIGKGAFGKVFLAEAYGIGGNEPTSLVAVKVLNGELLASFRFEDEDEDKDENEDQGQLLLIVHMLKSVTVMA